MSKYVNASPSPRSHIKTLQRLGYKFTTAIGDILDNSIAAKASNIDITFLTNDGVSFLEIIDDGCGMVEKDLISNMSIGCKNPSEERNHGDLGRFGSGLKTASFSQANKLTVISKTKNSDICAATWDIDHIVQTDSWELYVHDVNDIKNGPINKSIENQGTIVKWNDIYTVKDDVFSLTVDRQISQLCDHLHDYIGLYFHRYLVGSSKCNIKINGTDVNPKDPFMEGINGYVEGPSTSFKSKKGKVFIKAHILPPFNMMSNLEVDKYGGVSGITQKQGLYIYRGERLIVEGGWHGLKSISQLSGLARVQIDIPTSMDDDWETDVKKSTLTLPPKIKSALKRLIGTPVRKSRKAYEYKGQKDQENSYWDVIQNERTSKITYSFTKDNSNLNDLLSKTDGNFAKSIVAYLNQLCKSIPLNHIHLTMSEEPKSIDQGLMLEKDNDDWIEEIISND